LLRAIDGYAGREVVGIALKLAFLFFVRPGELRKARWRQFDLTAAQWRIPADCMKARVQHLVPLSRQALEFLLKLRTISGDTEYASFAARSLAPFTRRCPWRRLAVMGFESSEVTPHGFRSTACTLGPGQKLKFDASSCLPQS
jgi:integrase